MCNLWWSVTLFFAGKRYHYLTVANCPFIGSITMRITPSIPIRLRDQQSCFCLVWQVSSHELLDTIRQTVVLVHQFIRIYCTLCSDRSGNQNQWIGLFRNDVVTFSSNWILRNKSCFTEETVNGNFPLGTADFELWPSKASRSISIF